MSKKMIMVLAVIFIMGAWAGPAMCADPPIVKKGGPQVPPPPEVMRTTGTVESYAKGKEIQVATSGGAMYTFSIAADTVVEGKVRKGARVTVIYQKEKDKLIANKVVAVLR